MLCLLVGLVLPPSASAQARQGGWSHYADAIFRPVGADADLPDLLIPEVLAEDSRGFLWSGGESGLLRWDGYRFQTYGADTTTPDGLKDSYVQALHLDKQGTLWVGTVSGGLARYDVAHDRFVSVLPGTWTNGAEQIWGMDDDGAGGLWVATGGGLFHLGPDGKVLAHLKHQPGQAGSLASDMVLSVLRDHAGTLWVGTRSGLERGTSGNSSFAPFPVPTPDTVIVSRLMQDSAGRIWVGTRQHGAYVIGPDRAAARLIGATASAGPGEAATEINAVTEISPGRIWVGTYGHGIIEVNGATLATRTIRRDPAVPNTLSSDSVMSVYRDRSGIVWVGTGSGLSQYGTDTNGILTAYGYAGRADGLTGENIMAVLAQPDGTVWTGSQGNGFQVLTPAGPIAAGLAGRRVFCLAPMPDGSVLVGTDGGLFQADHASQHVARLDIPNHSGTEDVRALRVIGGTIWLGGRDDGLWQLQPGADGKLALLAHYDAKGSSNVRAIEPQADGRVALGTDDGVLLLNPSTGAMEHIAPDPTDPHGLNDGHIVSFLTDRAGRLWAGTDSAGVDVLTGRDAAGRPRFIRIGLADGLPNGDMNKMLLDHQGRVWISTDSGLAVVDPDSFAVRALRRADGVAINGYWSDAGAVTPDGDLIFGGTGGMTIVRPNQIVPWQFSPKVVVTEIHAGGQPVRAAEASPLIIQPDANSLEVGFAVLDYSAPDRNQYRYRLIGFDKGWVATDAIHRLAAYTNLPPGSYTLVLSGSNRNGVWTGQNATLAVHVLPAWYQTVWFQMVEVAGVLLLLTVTAQGWTFILRRRQKELERQVRDRTAELTASQMQLRHFAYFDTLTALPNRRAFNEEFRKLVEDSTAQARKFALLVIDLDGFKQVNDTLGHDSGDELLGIAAGRLRQVISDADFVARLGGDEFAVLLKDVRDRGRVEQVGDAIVKSLAAPMMINNQPVRTGASVGVALFPQHGQEQEDLYRHVDQALYEAKRTGRGMWRWYNAPQAKAC